MIGIEEAVETLDDVLTKVIRDRFANNMGDVMTPQCSKGDSQRTGW